MLETNQKSHSPSKQTEEVDIVAFQFDCNVENIVHVNDSSL